MEHSRRTKIIATIGPATNSIDSISNLINAGMDVARINASHGRLEDYSENIRIIRDVSKKLCKPIAIMFDLQGPKIRIGLFDGPPIHIESGDVFNISVGRQPENGEIPSDYDLLDKDVRVGYPLLINDGELLSEVIGVIDGRVTCRAKNSGLIEKRKGINLPQSIVSAHAISEKDKRNALFASSQCVDAIAMSFVRCKQDVLDLKKIILNSGYKTPIISKIETPQAVENLDDILNASWGVMVARGDLGVELAPEDVPMAQKKIIAAANKKARPVITATQMLDSMHYRPRPTRAEASDVANAVLDGTDAVMLSGETAVGKYPIESVQMMARIIRSAEAIRPTERVSRTVETIPEAVALACSEMAQELRAKAIVVFTRTGTTAILVSQHRTQIPIVAFTPTEEVQRRLSFVCGVYARQIEYTVSIDERIHLIDQALMKEEIAKREDLVVVCMAAPTAKPGSTNLVMVHHVGGSDLN